jgi:hypothetical protein
LRIHRVKGEAEIQTKGIGNLVNEIIAGNIPNLCNDLYTHVHEAFRTSNTRDHTRTTP